MNGSGDDGYYPSNLLHFSCGGCARAVMILYMGAWMVVVAVVLMMSSGVVVVVVLASSGTLFLPTLRISGRTSFVPFG